MERQRRDGTTFLDANREHLERSNADFEAETLAEEVARMMLAIWEVVRGALAGMPTISPAPTTEPTTVSGSYLAVQTISGALIAWNEGSRKRGRGPSSPPPAIPSAP